MKTMTITTIILLILIGFVAGVFSGLIGIGGALIIIPALIFFVTYGSVFGPGNQSGNHAAAYRFACCLQLL